MGRARHREPEPTGAMRTVDMTVTYRGGRRVDTIWTGLEDALTIIQAREERQDFAGNILDIQATRDEGRAVHTSVLLEDVVEITLRERESF